MIKLSILTSSEDFHSIRKEWNDLLFQSDCNVIFLRWEWLYNWWLVYGYEPNRLCLILAEENGRLVGIAPLYNRKGNWISPNELRFLGSNEVCSDYLDFIVLKGRENEITDSILSSINNQPDLWERLYLAEIPLKSGNLSRITSYFGNRKIKLKNPGSVCPFIDLVSPWEKILNSFSSNLKSIIKRKIKQFEIEQKGELIEIGLNEEIEVYFLEFVRLQKLRMNQKKINSPFLNPNFFRFHLEAVKLLSQTGNVKFMFLKVKGKLIAGIYLLIDNNKYYYYQSGFDPEWNQLSPGTLLFYYAIKKAHEGGHEEFDFLQGEESYKKLWTKKSKVNLKITIYNRSAKSRLFNYCEDAKEKVKQIIKPNMDPL